MTVHLTKATTKLLRNMCADHKLEEKVRGWSSWLIVGHESGESYIPQRRHVEALQAAGFIEKVPGYPTTDNYYWFHYWIPTDAGRAFVGAINAPQETTT